MGLESWAWKRKGGRGVMLLGKTGGLVPVPEQLPSRCKAHK